MVVEFKDFAGEVRSHFNFGIASREKIIAELLKLVIAVSDGRILPQGFSINCELIIEDWTMHNLSFKYAESLEPFPPEIRVDVGKIVDSIPGLDPKIASAFRAFGLRSANASDIPKSATFEELKRQTPSGKDKTENFAQSPPEPVVLRDGEMVRGQIR